VAKLTINENIENTVPNDPPTKAKIS